MNRSLAILMGVIGSCALLLGKTPKEIRKEAAPSTFTIMVTTQSGGAFQGSAFLVAPNLLLTNCHVVEGWKEGLAESVTSKVSYLILKVVAAEPNLDLALVQIEGCPDPPLSISPVEVEIGDEVVVIGAPKGLSGTISSGLANDYRDMEHRRLLQISASLSPGSSGGPVLNDRGEVVGVAVGALPDGQNLNFAVSARNVLEFLKSHAVPQLPALTPPSAGWEVVQHRGLEYVTADSVHAFYRFQRLTREEDNVLFRSTNTLMRWQLDSPYIFINNIKFCLSFPVISVGDKNLISRVDLQKLMDPVLRPWYIQNAKQFETVIIDAGRGGDDVGWSGKQGTEKDLTLELARRLRDEVKARGLKVSMTRDSDLSLTPAQRIEIVNSIPDSILVSLRFGLDVSPDVSGIQTRVLAPQGTDAIEGGYSVNANQGNQRDGENVALGCAIHAMIMSKLVAFDQGLTRTSAEELRGVTKPGAIVIGGHLTNSGEAQKIASAEYRAELAKAIADGIVNFRNALKK